MLVQKIRVGGFLSVRIGDKRVFIKVSDPHKTVCRVHVDAPEEIDIQFEPRRGEEDLWPDGGMTPAAVKRRPGAVQAQRNLEEQERKRLEEQG